jgi:large subunit ribosomal protein L31
LEAPDEGIHPKYHEVDAHCVRATWKTHSKARAALEICSNCHPFFTGKQKLLDTEGRVRALHEEMVRRRKAEEGRQAARRNDVRPVTILKASRSSALVPAPSGSGVNASLETSPSFDPLADGAAPRSARGSGTRPIATAVSFAARMLYRLEVARPCS